VKDSEGNVVEVLAEFDPNSKGGNPADGRKIKGTIHWVDSKSCIDAQVRLYDNLFTDPEPDSGEKNFLNCINPNSLQVLDHCKLEASLQTAKVGESFQFMRMGYFCLDSQESTGEQLIFNRSVTLKDSFKVK
jgi:glutaminyl-tRNA synthetase